MFGSGNEFEGVAVGGAHNSEVAVVHRRDRGDVDAFSDRDDAGVPEVEAQVLVVAAKVDSASPVVTREVECLEILAVDETQELLMDAGAEPIENQP